MPSALASLPSQSETPSAAQTPDAPACAMRVQAEVLTQRRFDAAAAAFVTGLAEQFGFDVVSLGLLHGHFVQVVAASDGQPAQQDADRLHELGAAMDEAREQGLTVLEPSAAGAAITLAHAVLLRRYGGTVCTIPLVAAGAAVGAVTFRRESAKPIDAGEVERLEHIVCLVGPVLHLLWQREQPLHARLREAVLALGAQVRGPGGRKLRWGFGAAAALLALLLLVPVERQVAGRARIEGVVQRVLVAPSDGYIHATHVRPGDSVQAGAVIAELTDKDLRLEQRKWSSQLRQFQNAHASAVARADRVQAVISLARMQEAQAELELVGAKLSRGRIEAPFDGVVIQGDLTASIGAPVKQGDALLTVAREDGFRIIVEIDERDILPVRVGQSGSIALSALPWDALPVRVTRVTPMTVAVDGANVFEVEAELLERPSDVRPGLRGVAKISAGEQPLLLGWTRRAIDWLRLWLWTWVG